jgi:inner membrane protein YidH
MHRSYEPASAVGQDGVLTQSQEIVASWANGTDMETDTAVRDATRRTRLANERTYLAWWRTGLTALAVSFGAGRLLPELSQGPNWPFELVGIAFAVVGIVFMTYGYVRHREVEAALDRGDYERLPDRAAFALAAVGALLGVATVVLVLLHTT